MTERKLLWMPEGVGSCEKTCPPMPYDGDVPKKLWSLRDFCDPDNPPPLTIELKHSISTFMEDKGHDWVIRKGQLFYRSQVTDGGLWLMLEF